MPRLDVVGEVMVDPARVPQVSNLHADYVPDGLVVGLSLLAGRRRLIEGDARYFTRKEVSEMETRRLVYWSTEGPPLTHGGCARAYADFSRCFCFSSLGEGFGEAVPFVEPGRTELVPLFPPIACRMWPYLVYLSRAT